MMFDMCIYICFVYKMCVHFTQRMSLHSKSAPFFFVVIDLRHSTLLATLPDAPGVGPICKLITLGTRGSSRGGIGDQGIIWGRRRFAPEKQVNQ